MIILSGIEVIEGTAKVTQRALGPVIFIDDLHFQIDDDIVIQNDFDIKDKCLLIDGAAQFNGIGYHSGLNLFGLQVEQCADQAPQNLVIALKQCPEQVVIGHADSNGTCGGV